MARPRRMPLGPYPGADGGETSWPRPSPHAPEDLARWTLNETPPSLGPQHRGETPEESAPGPPAGFGSSPITK